MSTLAIQERFTVDADPGLVWAHLADPYRTVTCLPGAEILGQDDERTYRGAVKVKVGAVTVAYRGTIVFEQLDEAERSLKAVGTGREKSGSGSAEMAMEGRVLALDDGRSEVVVDARIRLTGKIVRFGRGMIDTISAEIFADFRTRLSQQLRDATAGEGEGPTGDDASAGRDAGAVGSGSAGSEGARSGAAGSASAGSGAAGAAATGSGATGSEAPRRGDDDTLRLLPLLLRAFLAWLRKLFRLG